MRITPSRRSLAVFAIAALAASPALAASVTYSIALTGPAEVPPAPVEGHGTASIIVDAAKGKLCYTLTAKGTDTPTMAHVHKGAIGVAGDVVVALDPPATGKVKGCKTVPSETLNAIVADPASYYVNVHTAKYPAGAMRGQLGQ
jgi:hypothetical protein